ncbi:Aspergillopepsin [Lachnellula subtilissima]|uniref:Aspergillopepsin n=1 Tax=Lachnellula subtilissima TaxID=602034 RepID=A0A8H8RXD7_9HELO|nr:Aspergillopepsin [Lachnellula subtilissima]
MKYSLIALSNALLFSTAFAGIAQRIERRSDRVRSTHPKIPATGTTDGFDNETNVQYSSNWAGAVLTAPPAGTTFNAVSAKFVVPTPSGSGSASAWVGIDGDTYTNSILQTGLDFTVTNGKVSYDAWYEWYPDYAYDFTGISFSAGDSVSVSVKSSSSTAGTAVIENLTTGKTVSKALTSTAALGGQNAEWIVEDFEENGSLVTFADFGAVTFTDATAGYTGGSEGSSGASLLDIKQSSKVLTSSSLVGSDEVVINMGWGWGEKEG